MKFETQYKALSLNKSGALNHENLDKIAKLSWLAMGIYQYLLLHGSQSITQLGHRSPTTPFAVISSGLHELIEQEFIIEVVDGELVQGGAA